MSNSNGHSKNGSVTANIRQDLNISYYENEGSYIRIYVAGKWELKPRVREVMFLLKQAGHTITHDWTVHSTSHNPSVLRQEAVVDLRGVADCDVFVGVFEEEVKYSGALSELGAALAHGKPVYIIGNAQCVQSNIFFKHPHVRHGLEAFTRDLLMGAI